MARKNPPVRDPLVPKLRAAVEVVDEALAALRRDKARPKRPKRAKGSAAPPPKPRG